MTASRAAQRISTPRHVARSRQYRAATTWGLAAKTCLAWLVALACLMLIGMPAANASANSDPDADSARVVVIGVSGLSWADITDSTPALQGLTSQGVGSLIVRSTTPNTCPIDGWLGLSSGTRISYRAEPSTCPPLPKLDSLTAPTDGTDPGAGVLPEWNNYLDAASGQDYHAQLGLLTHILTGAGIKPIAIGPGAAIATANPAGKVPQVEQRAEGENLTSQVATAVNTSPAVFIDAGTLGAPEDESGLFTSTAHAADQPQRRAQVQRIDERISRIVAGINSATTVEPPLVVLTGVADSGSSGLRVAALAGPGVSSGLLTSSSTRQSGYVKKEDIFATILDHLSLRGEIPTEASSGVPVQIEQNSANASEHRAQLVDANLHAQVVKPIVPVFFLLLVAVNLVLFAAMAVLLKRSALARVLRFFTRWHTRTRSDKAVQARPMLRTMQWAGLAVGALPLASYLANLVPWWRATPAALALAGLIIAIDALVVAAALWGPWRWSFFGPAAFIATITALTLGIDVLTGATLQISSVMGVSTLVGARLYGMNNTSFSLFTVTSMVAVIASINPMLTRGKRKQAAIVIAVVGLIVAALDGAPGIGADFGGPPAILVGFAIAALLTWGIRLTWRRVLIVVVAAAAASFALAFADWLRPPTSRTHLGRFFQTVLDGGLWQVVWRKLDQNISILFGNRPLTILAICGALVVIYVLARPIKTAVDSPAGSGFAWISGGTPLSAMGEQMPALRPGLIGITAALIVGLAINDSGIAIPAVGISVAVPLLIATTVAWMRSLAPNPTLELEVD